MILTEKEIPLYNNANNNNQKIIVDQLSTNNLSNHSSCSRSSPSPISSTGGVLSPATTTTSSTMNTFNNQSTIVTHNIDNSDRCKDLDLKIGTQFPSIFSFILRNYFKFCFAIQT